jgi:hypothetical protein
MRAIDWARTQPTQSKQNPFLLLRKCILVGSQQSARRWRRAEEEAFCLLSLSILFLGQCTTLAGALHNASESGAGQRKKERPLCPCHLASPTAHHPRTHKDASSSGPRDQNALMIFKRDRPLEIHFAPFVSSQFSAPPDDFAKLARAWRGRAAGILIRDEQVCGINTKESQCRL